MIQQKHLLENNLANIRNLAQLTKKLLNYADVNNDIEFKLIYILRKLEIASFMFERNTICVTGLQGSGKSTLMKTFYDLDLETFAIDVGRCETLPIFITEKNIETVQFYSTSVNDENKIDTKEITCDDFKNKSKEDVSGSKCLFLELFVPYKHTKNENISFVLMPGYETDQDSYWKDLIDFTILSSNVALFVCNYQLYASKNNQETFEHIKENFGNNILFALTWSDCNLKQNIEIKKELIEKYSLQESQVICTSSEENEKAYWKQELIDAIQRFNSAGKKDSLFNNILELRSEINEMITHLEDTIEDKKNISDNIDCNFKPYLECFNKRISELRKDFSKSLKNFIDAQKTESRKVFDEDMKGNEKTFQFYLNNVGKLIFGKKVKDITEIDEKVEKALKSNDKPRYIKAISESIINNETETLLLEFISKDCDKELCVREPDESKIEQLNNTLCSLLEGKEYVADNNEKAFTLLADCSVFYFTKSLLSKVSLEINQESLFKEEEQEKVKDILTGTKKTALGLLALAGIDYIPDQKFNLLESFKNFLFPGAAGAAGAAGATAVSLGAVMASCTAGLIIAGVATSLTARAIHKGHIEDYYTGCNAITNYYDSIYNTIMSDFDDFIDKVRNKFMDNYRNRIGYERELLNLYNSECAIGEYKKQVTKVFKTIRENYDYLEV